MPRRRGILRGLGAAATLTAAPAVLAGPAAADHPTNKPENVSVSYNTAKLARYAPELVFEAETREKFLGLYGAWITSSEQPLDAAYYWASYSHQEGVSPFGGVLSDSHQGDHEPVIVFADSETGEPRMIVASIYHWLAGKEPASDVAMAGDGPRLKVVKPWHQYTAAATEGVRPDVEDLTAAIDDWLANGLEEALAESQPYDPWAMLTDRRSWWKESSRAGISFDQLFVEAMAFAGIGEIGSLE